MVEERVACVSCRLEQLFPSDSLAYMESYELSACLASGAFFRGLQFYDISDNALAHFSDGSR